MRITYLLDRFPALSETFVLDQVAGMVQRDQTVTVLARTGEEADRVHPAVSRHDLRTKTTHLEVPSSWWRRLGRALRLFGGADAAARDRLLGSLNAASFGREALSLKLFYAARAFLETGPFDVVHAHFGPVGRLGAHLKTIGAFDAPLVTTFHGQDIRRGLEEGGGIYRDLFDVGDLFLAVSEYNRRHLEDFGAPPERIRRHTYGVDLDRFKPPGGTADDPSGDVKVLTVARLVAVKGLFEGLEAIRGLADQLDRTIHYTIVGGGPLEDDLRDHSRKLGLEGLVTFTGARGREGVRASLREHDVFFLPSRAEALPVSLLEAMACGRPAVATDVGSVREAIEDAVNGFVVPPRDPEAMADALRRLCEDPERRRTMGSRARSYVEEHHDLAALNDRLLERYRDLVGGALEP